MSLITGIHHIALKCCGMEHYEKTIAFYKDILGIPTVREWGEGVHLGIMLDTGAGILEIFSDGVGMPGEGALRHIAFATKDTDACIEAVRNAGYKITEEPHDIVIPAEIPYPARIAFCIGPAGETVEFFCEK